jgi:putative PD-(D/E)XK family protein DUF4420
MNAGLDAWVGPSGSIHDIVVKGCRVEVKTTTSMQNRHAVIHGLSQLADIGDAALYLVSVRLIRDPDGEISLRSLVESASSVGVSNVEIYARAAAAGIDASSLAAAASRTFRHVDSLIFEVDDNFPRLTEGMIGGSLPQGVLDVRYTVRLDGISPMTVELRKLCQTDRGPTGGRVD